MNKKLGLFAFLWIFIVEAVCEPLLIAQTNTSVRYIYDEAGRLIGSIDENNTATAYRYDGVGNLVAIEPLTARGPVDIFFVEPNRGRAAVPPQPGTPVTIHGIGFSAMPAQNQVTFNGISAVVDASTTTMIETSVPAGARTGPVRVTSPLGTATSRSDFIVLSISVTVSPSSAVVGVGLDQQFTATVTEAGSVLSSTVIWSISPSVGTINANGLYTAPPRLPPQTTVNVTATSTEDPTARGTATITIVQTLGPIFASASFRTYSRVNPLGPIFASASFRTYSRVNALSPIFASASYGIRSMGAISDSEDDSSIIAITELNPNTLLRGARDIPFAVTGRHFDDATALDFLRPDGEIDTDITVTNLTVSPDGTQIIASISVAEEAAVGPRTVIVRTPIGPSTTMATDSNQLVVE